jgi:shikimate dehydrogenase
MHWSEVGPGIPNRTRIAVLGEPPDSETMSAALTTGMRQNVPDSEVLPLACELEELQDCLAHLTVRGVSGVSVGNPHKPMAAKLASKFYIAKHSLGVANALMLGEQIYAQNTEVPAFQSTLSNLEPATALVLGSGRAARSAVMGLLDSGWKVKLWNRNLLRSKPLVTLFLRYGQIETVPTADPAGCSLIVNATSLGRKPGEQPPVIWSHAKPRTTAVDYVYRGVATEFLRSAARFGFKAIDGRQLLVEQAALAMEWWLQKPIERQPMLEAVGYKAPLAF